MKHEDAASAFPALLRSQAGQPFLSLGSGQRREAGNPRNHVSCADHLGPIYPPFSSLSLRLSRLLSSAARGWRVAGHGARENGRPGMAVAGNLIFPPLTPRPEISVLHGGVSARLMGNVQGKGDVSDRSIRDMQFLVFAESCFSQGSGLDSFVLLASWNTTLFCHDVVVLKNSVWPRRLYVSGICQHYSIIYTCPTLGLSFLCLRERSITTPMPSVRDVDAFKCVTTNECRHALL